MTGRPQGFRWRGLVELFTGASAVSAVSVLVIVAYVGLWVYAAVAEWASEAPVEQGSRMQLAPDRERETATTLGSHPDRLADGEQARSPGSAGSSPASHATGTFGSRAAVAG